MHQPRIRFAKSGPVSIAYEVIGDGPLDLIMVPGIVSNIEYFHQLPGYTDFLESLARFARVIVFDKRGNGLSDRPEHIGTLEDRIDDVRAVMDAVGVERAAVLGWSEGGPMSVLFAATHPDRVSHMMLFGAFARYVGDGSQGEISSREVFEQFSGWVVEQWGQGGFVHLVAPSIVGTPTADLFEATERNSASPGTVRQLWDAVAEIDIRPALGLVKAPTLVMRRSHEIMPASACRYLADTIPGARYLEVDGVDHVPWVGDSDAITSAIREFVTGDAAGEPAEDDSVLATVLFADIVGSTSEAARLGDRRWRDVLDQFHSTFSNEIDRHRGRVVNTRGDDVLAAFDGPARAVRCAQALVGAASRHGLAVRCGVHTGEVQLRGDDLAGLAVHIGARVSALAAAGEVLATTTVRDLVVGSGLRFVDRGAHALKGVPGEWQLVALTS